MRLTSILALAGVLGAGSAAAVVNAQVLSNTEADDATVAVDANVDAAVQIYSDLLSPSQVMFQVRDAGTVTLDTAGGVLSIVAANANSGWVVVDNFVVTLGGTVDSVTNGAATGAAGDVNATVDSATNIDLGGTADGVTAAVDSATNIDLGGAAGGVGGVVDSVTNIDLGGAGLPAVPDPVTAVNGLPIDALPGAGGAATDAVIAAVIGFQSLANDSVVQITAVLNIDGTIDTKVEDSGVADDSGTDDGDGGDDGTDNDDGNGNGGNGDDGVAGDNGTDDGTGDDDGTGQVCTLTNALVSVCLDADVDINNGQINADADVDARVNLNDD